jgi:hypothetical protein
MWSVVGSPGEVPGALASAPAWEAGNARFAVP